MNCRLQLFGLLLAIVFLSPVAAQEASNDFPYNAYKPSSISALTKEAQRTKAQSVDLFLSNNDVKVIMPVESYRLRLTFVGEVRPLVKETRLFLEFIAKVFPHIPEKQWATYTHEIHVKEGSTDMWQPIQGQILTTLIPALSPGKQFDAYVFWLGENNGQQICVINAATTFKK